MEQPPTPSTPEQPQDLPQPPIWDRPATSSTPPIVIPSAAAEPIVPDIGIGQIPQVAPAAPSAPAPFVPPARPAMPPVARLAPAQPVLAQPVPAQPVPAQPALAQPAPAQPLASGPAFTRHPGTSQPGTSQPSVGVATAAQPQWPSAPPVAGQVASAAAPVANNRRPKRAALAALALLMTSLVVGGAFLFGRSWGANDTASVTPVAAAPATAPPIEPTTPPATAIPATPVPATPPANDAPAPVPLPLDGAVEPVAAVAQAVAPAVVLVQNDLGQGSGIIYDQSGLILTNAHVVGSFTEVSITLASGVRVPGVVLGADPLTDVAVISIDTDSEFGVAILAPESSVQVGQLAVAIGSPFGLEQTVTSGVVSAVGRVLENQTDDGRFSVVSMVQTDAPINPGNSGGALADRQGRVIGMNTSIRTDGSGGSVGVGFAIPADTAKLIADRIIAGESLERGFLGIGGGTPAIGDPGVVVREVTPGSGADAAGLQVDDLITGFNGQPIRSMSDLAAAVRLQAPDATIIVDFIRDGQLLSAEVTLGVLTGQ